MAPREGGRGGRQLIAVRHAKDRDFANGHKNVREEGAIWRGEKGMGGGRERR